MADPSPITYVDALSFVGTMIGAGGVTAIVVAILGARKSNPGTPAAPSPPPPQEVVQQTPWLITTLTTIGVQSQTMQRDIDAIEQAFGHVHREMSALREIMERIEKLLRGRTRR